MTVWTEDREHRCKNSKGKNREAEVAKAFPKCLQATVTGTGKETRSGSCFLLGGGKTNSIRTSSTLCWGIWLRHHIPAVIQCS